MAETIRSNKMMRNSKINKTLAIFRYQNKKVIKIISIGEASVQKLVKKQTVLIIMRESFN